jgi:phosphatidylethanolamine-binding protein
VNKAQCGPAPPPSPPSPRIPASPPSASSTTTRPSSPESTSPKPVSHNYITHRSLPPSSHPLNNIAEAQNEPTFTLPPTLKPSNKDTTYVLISLDLDAPFPSFSILGPILHKLRPNMKACENGDLKSETPPIAEYIGPAPPPGSGPHRYAFFLYEQPATFDARKFAAPNGKDFPVTKRMFYGLDAFEREAKVGKILACNYFRST